MVPSKGQPLANRLRPTSLEDMVGQDHLLGKTGPIARMVRSGRPTSMILWGPPGCGKTTMARLLTSKTNIKFQSLSAVFSGVAELRKIFSSATSRRVKGQATLLFVDEIHRFNRSQQDGFLPYVEDGTIILVGATTENPSFELNAALLSRCQVYILNRLDDSALEDLLLRAETDAGRALPITADARAALRTIADGDGRYIITLAEDLFSLKVDIPEILSIGEVTALVQKRAPIYDKDREGHYNLISAVHKSLRGSDPDAALYWVSRMLDGGEDAKYILRRLSRFAIEDIGLADPNAISQALAAWELYERLGSPEGDLAVAYLVIYLATAPKSNAAYSAFSAAMAIAKKTGSLMPPKHILNAPTRLMQKSGYGEGYEYDHNDEEGFSGQNYFPDGLQRNKFYSPPDRGFERDINKRLLYWEELRRKKSSNKGRS